LLDGRLGVTLSTNLDEGRDVIRRSVPERRAYFGNPCGVHRQSIEATNGMEPSRSAVLASRKNGDYQRATGPIYRASFSTGGYRRLTTRFLRVSLDLSTVRQQGSSTRIWKTYSAVGIHNSGRNHKKEPERKAAWPQSFGALPICLHFRQPPRRQVRPSF
jgi:hypothetical protein